MRYSKIRIALSIVSLFLIFSCNKDGTIDSPIDEHPQMEYFELDNKGISYGLQGYSFDVNHDGRKDIRFYVQLVGDPIAQVDKVQFIVLTNIAVCLPVNATEEIPMMNNGDTIVPDNFNGYQWFELSAILLMQKIISSTGPASWDGLWINAAHQFIPFQVLNNGEKYNGWVEMSADTVSEKIILHKAAISKMPGLDIYAGN